MTDSELPLVHPPFDRGTDGDDPEDNPPRVAGVLLAAGTSDRFGVGNKLLALRDGTPVVRCAARTLVEGNVDPIVVVVGHEADRARDALDGLPVETAYNEVYDAGQASSVRTGIQAVRDIPVEAVVVALGDMPFVTPDTIDALVAAYVTGVGDALAAAHDGDRGNPVLFDRRFFDPLADLEGDDGGREILLEGDESALVEVSDRGVRRDVDEPSDL